MERRIYMGGECRFDDEAGELVGHAAVFHREGDPGTEFELMGPGVMERVAPGAFDRALSEGDDVRALFNHDANIVLGRAVAGTMTLDVTDIGLRYRIQFDGEDPDHVRIRRKVERGDITGSSFGFRVNKETWETRAGVEYRWLEDVHLYDVGPVTFPAYKATDVAARGEWEHMLSEYRAHQTQSAEAVERRLSAFRKAQAQAIMSQIE